MPSPALLPLRKGLTLAEGFDPRQNAFAFLRLTLALLVVVSHCFRLGGFGSDPLAKVAGAQHTIGLVSVGMFFVLSGFLISRSALRSASTVRFLWHRVLRIFPGYWICLLVCAFVFGPLVALYEHGQLFTRIFSAPKDSPQAFVLNNALLFHTSDLSLSGVINLRPLSIAGLLSHNPFPWVVNGSLWSLPYEFACYLGVGALAALGVLRRRRFVILAFFLTLWGLYTFSFLDAQRFAETFPYAAFPELLMFSLYFSAGCTAFLYREKIPFSTGWMVLSLAAVGASLLLGLFGTVAPVALSYAFLWLAFKIPLRNFDAKGDFSYGTYIYAFPVQQGLALLGVHHGGFFLYLTWSLLITIILAILSYRWIEAPCLRWKNFDPVHISGWGRKMPSRAPMPDPALPASL